MCLGARDSEASYAEAYGVAQDVAVKAVTPRRASARWSMKGGSSKPARNPLECLKGNEPWSGKRF